MEVHGKSYKKIPFTEVVEPVVKDLVAIWEKASIPTIAEKGIVKAVSSLQEEKKRALKNEKLKKQIQENNQSLFDISACKCSQIPCAEIQCPTEDCDEVHIECKCDADRKVPMREIGFLFDQRGPRKMFMSGIDLKVTQRLQRSEKRDAATEARREKEVKRLRTEAEQQKTANEEFFANDDEEDDNVNDDQSFDKNYVPDEPIASTSCPKTRNMQPLPKTGAACDRWGVHSEAAADIINTYLMELGTLTPETMANMTVDRSKLNRWRKSGRENLQKKENHEMESRPVQAIYFDVFYVFISFLWFSDSIILKMRCPGVTDSVLHLSKSDKVNFSGPPCLTYLIHMISP